MSGIIDSSFLQQVVLIVIGVAISGVSSVIAYYVRAYFKSRSDCFKAMQEELKKQGARGVRQSKAIILMSKTQDTITNRLHPDEKPPIDTTAIIDAELRDEFDEL